MSRAFGSSRGPAAGTGDATCPTASETGDRRDLDCAVAPQWGWVL